MSSDILLGATSTAPFVQQAALAFAEVGRLRHYATTLVDRPQQYWRRVLRGVPALGRRIDRALSRRSVDPLLQPLLRTRARDEGLRLLAGRLDRSGVWTDRLWARAQQRFDHWLATQVEPTLHAVYAFETGARASFQRAQALGVARWYEVNAAEHDHVHALLAQETARYPQLVTDYTRHTRRLQAARTAWRQAEWALADRVLVYSRYVRQTYADAGYPIDRVQVVPLAAPTPLSLEQMHPQPPGAPLHLVWVGSFSIRKGAHRLLEVWRQRQFGRHATLAVYGRNELPDAALAGSLQGICFHGSVPQVELRSAWLAADALLFPTLSDSFGMVVTEALAHGCPVLTTTAAGAGELLRDGQDGRVIPAADDVALAELLHWALDCRDHLRAWKPQALASAARHSWADYRRALRRACGLDTDAAH